MEQRTCQHCQKVFTVRAADQAYYQRLQVPTPIKCPQCRFQLRMSFRNEHFLYPRQCVVCQRSTLSSYSEDKPYTIYCRACWWKDNWSPLQYGRDIDWSKPFFEQFAELRRVVPRAALLNDASSLNSEYCNRVSRLKNCYMVFDAVDDEDSLYCTGVYGVKDNVDCSYTDATELCYETIYSAQCYQLKNSRDCLNCHHSDFLADCVGVANSFMCVGLRNVSYCYKNKQLTQVEFERVLASYALDTTAGVERAAQEFSEFAAVIPRRYYHGVQNEDCAGNYLLHNKNVYYSFQTRSSENCAYSYGVHHAKDSYDYTIWGEDAELIYEGHAVGGQCSRLWFCNVVWYGQENYYCDHCLNGQSYNFGCVGLKNERYCILNKQCTEADFFTIRDRLIEHMRTTGEWGQFFPPPLSDFAYNETLAQEFFPLTKTQAQAAGWQWQDHLPGTYGKETISTAAMPARISEVPDSITQAILACRSCQKNYRIVQAELNFYRRLQIPLPRLCPDCRHTARLRHRSPYQLWQRQCMCQQADHAHANQRCSVQFETAYAPMQPEIIYCDSCYQKMIY